MNDRLAALRLFLRVARTGSFSRAAREAGLSQPSASRIIARLEADLGAGLFLRSTRVVRLTETGADYLARVAPLLAALAEADHAARGTGALRGLLRIGLSTGFGVREVIPRLPDFLERHSSLRVELMMTDIRQDLIAEGADLALRLGRLPDSGLVARRLAEAPRLVVASPAYLMAHGCPKVPAELAGHKIIAGPLGVGPTAWSFTAGGRRASVVLEPRLTVAANEGATACAVAGLGIALMSRWGCARELEDGRLRALLPDWETEPVPLHAIFPAGRAASPATRAFADHLAAGLGSA